MTDRRQAGSGNLSRLAAVFVLVFALLTQSSIPLSDAALPAHHPAAVLGLAVGTATDICHSEGGDKPASAPADHSGHCLLCQVPPGAGAPQPFQSTEPVRIVTVVPVRLAGVARAPAGPVAWLSPFSQGPPA